MGKVKARPKRALPKGPPCPLLRAGYETHGIKRTGRYLQD